MLRLPPGSALRCWAISTVTCCTNPGAARCGRRSTTGAHPSPTSSILRPGCPSVGCIPGQSYSTYIDFIVLSRSLGARIVPGSFQRVTYSAKTPGGRGFRTTARSPYASTCGPVLTPRHAASRIPGCRRCAIIKLSLLRYGNARRHNGNRPRTNNNSNRSEARNQWNAACTRGTGQGLRCTSPSRAAAENSAVP